MAATREQILDRISSLLIENFSNPSLNNLELSEWHQAVVSGSIQYKGTHDVDEIILFGSDVVADREDSRVIQWLYDYMNPPMNDLTADAITFNPDSLTFLVNGVAISSINPDFNSVTLINNFSQYIDFDETYKKIDSVKAQEVLDTEIFELLPTALSRQQQINNFFNEYERLKGHLPPYELDNDNNFEPDTMTPGTHAEYSGSHDISAMQIAGTEDDEGFITRLDSGANTGNIGKTLQSLRDDLNLYLKDIDVDPITDPQDDRPLWEHQSPGYLKIRHLNQGMIIRKQEGDDIGIEQLVRNPIDNSWGPSYLQKGFTITMWVKFLDRVNKGTLFNYGNPMRLEQPKGFKLETFVINKDDELPSQPGVTWSSIAPAGYFMNNDYERFVRLIVRDTLSKDEEVYPTGKLYDSHFGMSDFPYNKFIPEFGKGPTDTVDYKRGNEAYLFTHTRVPIDLDEWYFICASYDPSRNDIATGGDFEETPEYWNGNIIPGTNPLQPTYTHSSGYGSKCKVEIISKSDLVRARGFKLEEE